MTEPQNQPTAGPQDAPPQDAAVRAGSRRKPFAYAAGAVALALLVGGGVWASAAIADADRVAPTAYWAAAGKELPKAESPSPVPGNALSSKLLPVPSDFTLGPDLDDDGNDFVISGEKAAEGIKESRKGLSSSDRKKRDEMLADLKLKGLAGRGYQNEGPGMFAVEIRLMQADPKALGSFSEIAKKFLDAVGDDRDAPKVDGFPDAKCSLIEVFVDKEKEIDSLSCVAVEGDVLVNFRAYGPKAGFPKTEAAGFFKNQLNHLKSPGESV
ncbi:hypothetical protein ACIOD1_05835 [Streptomyces sp. NPDC088097]|uniref:hypothetical protein n=1 Tax=Streptomyces sp. NPDC088097 TaxID=3365823 RepID=UPI0037F9E60C